MKETALEKFLRRIKTKRYRVFLTKRFILVIALLTVVCGVFGGIKSQKAKNIEDEAITMKIEEEKNLEEKRVQTYDRFEMVADETKEADEQISHENENANDDIHGKTSLGTFKLTAYCSCEKCCGVWAMNRPTDGDGNEIVYGASGEVLVAGISVAVDPDVIPYGTEIEICGNRYIAHDCGGAIKENRIDVYFDNHQDALNFGVQYADIFLIK